jgi:NAD(P)-dependent dehydrogenase (short-subunit alcohol dehydrogenase family)
MGSVAGRVVVVTGVTSGIGRAVAARLAAEGATVVGCARDPERLAEVAAAEPTWDLRRADVRAAADRAGLVEGVLADHGRIDVLVNNAGLGWQGLVEDMPADDVEQLYRTNVIAPVDLTRRVLPHFLDRGSGDVVFTSSGAAFVALPPLTVYSSTKYAIDGFVEGLRREVWTRGVRVHSVNPGPVRTEWLARSRGAAPAEGEAPPSPGVPVDWVAAAVHRSLVRPYGRTVSVPRAVGLGRLLATQPLRTVVDVATGLNAGRIARKGRQIAEDHTPR